MGPADQPPPAATSEPSTSPTRAWYENPVLLCAIAVASFALPYAHRWGIVGKFDFDQYVTFNQIALWWHAIGDASTAWNPYLCGGSTLIGNPQIPLYHPNLPLYWLFGPVNGLSMSFLVWGAFGYWGMWRLGEQHGLRPNVRAWIAAAWTLNGFFIGQLGNMHAQYTAFYTLPLLFSLNRDIAERADRWAIAFIPLALALPSLYNHHFLAYSFPFVVAHFLFELWHHRKSDQLLLKGGVYLAAIFLVIGMIAIFLLPSLAWSREFPRYQAPEFEHPLNLIQMLFFPVQIYPFERVHGMFERYFTLGPILFWLLVIGVRRGFLFDSSRRTLGWLSVAALVTAMGSFEVFGWPPVVPFDLLRNYAPGYQAMRVPPRFFINAIPALLLVVGLEWSRRIESGKWSKKGHLGRLAVTLVPLWLFNVGYIEFKLFEEQVGLYRAQPASISDEFRWAPEGHFFSMSTVLAPNVGVLDCYDAIEVPRADALRFDRALVLDSSVPVKVGRQAWGDLVVHTATRSAAAPTRVQLNINHHRHWRIVESDGPAAVTSKMRTPLTLELDGARRVRVRYDNPIWPVARRVTLMSLALAGLWLVGWLWTRR